MMFELRIDIFDHFNIIWSLYCEPAPLFTLQAQATTPSIFYIPGHKVTVHQPSWWLCGDDRSWSASVSCTLSPFYGQDRRPEYMVRVHPGDMERVISIYAPCSAALVNIHF